MLLHGVTDDGQVLEAGQSLLEPSGAFGVRLLQEPQKQVGGGDLEVDGNVEAVGVTVDDVKPAPADVVGVRFVAGVDQWPGAGRCRGDRVPHLVGRWEKT